MQKDALLSHSLAAHNVALVDDFAIIVTLTHPNIFIVTGLENSAKIVPSQYITKAYKFSRKYLFRVFGCGYFSLMFKALCLLSLWFCNHIFPCWQKNVFCRSTLVTANVIQG